MAKDDGQHPGAGEPLIRLQQFLPYRLSVTSNAVSGRIARFYEERFGLGIPEWRMLAALAELKRAVPQDLGRTTRMDKVTVSRATRKLKDKGLVAESSNARDGRSYFLSLTGEGQRLYQAVAPMALAYEAKLLRHFSAAEVQQFTSMLQRLEAAAAE